MRTKKRFRFCFVSAGIAAGQPTHRKTTRRKEERCRRTCVIQQFRTEKSIEIKGLAHDIWFIENAHRNRVSLQRVTLPLILQPDVPFYLLCLPPPMKLREIPAGAALEANKQL